MGIFAIDKLVWAISNMLDIDECQINILVCMLISYKCGYINRYIYGEKKRLIFGLFCGLILQFQMFGPTMIHIVIATLNTFLFIQFFGRKLSSFYVLFFNILHLSYLHLRTMNSSFGKWTLGIETCYMMSICKFSSIAFNYEDGGKPENELKSSHFVANAIKEKPTLLETFSFVFYYPTALVGPSFEFSDFKRFIRLEGEYNKIRWRECTKSALSNLFWVFIFCILIVKFIKVADPNYCGSEEFSSKSILYKFSYVYFSLLITRCRYYIGWKLGQGSLDFCGLSYTAKVNKNGVHEISFDKVDVCNLTVMEFTITPRVKIQYWNRSVHLWLKYYLYLRLINTKMLSKNKGLASLITFSVSAFWHGFYPNFYLFFIQYFFIEQITDYLEKRYDLFNRISKSNFFIKFIAWHIVMCILIYFGQTFTLLSFELTLNYYRAFYFVPNIILLICYICITFFVKRKKLETKLS